MCLGARAPRALSDDSTDGTVRMAAADDLVAKERVRQLNSTMHKLQVLRMGRPGMLKRLQLDEFS